MKLMKLDKYIDIIVLHLDPELNVPKEMKKEKKVFVRNVGEALEEAFGNDVGCGSGHRKYAEENEDGLGDGGAVMLIMSGMVVRMNMNRMWLRERVLYGLRAGCECHFLKRMCSRNLLDFSK